MAASIKAVLFDLGGVVIDIDFGKVFSVWAQYAGCDMAQIRGRFQMDDLYKAHETGHVSGEEFFAGLRKSLDVNLTDQQFTEGWNSIFVGEVPGIARLLKAAAKRYPLYAFSNTNEIHKAHMLECYGAVLSNFEAVFISSQMGVRKPDPAAFTYVIKQIGAPPTSILFFDDTKENVEGARNCSLNAVHVKSIKDVIDARIT